MGSATCACRGAVWLCKNYQRTLTFLLEERGFHKPDKLSLALLFPVSTALIGQSRRKLLLGLRIFYSWYFKCCRCHGDNFCDHCRSRLPCSYRALEWRPFAPWCWELDWKESKGVSRGFKAISLLVWCELHASRHQSTRRFRTNPLLWRCEVSDRVWQGFEASLLLVWCQTYASRR